MARTETIHLTRMISQLTAELRDNSFVPCLRFAARFERRAERLDVACSVSQFSAKLGYKIVVICLPRFGCSLRRAQSFYF